MWERFDHEPPAWSGSRRDYSWLDAISVVTQLPNWAIRSEVSFLEYCCEPVMSVGKVSEGILPQALTNPK